LEKKNVLTNQLNSLATLAEKNKKGTPSPKKKLVPDNTSISMYVKYNFDKGYPELVLSTKNSAVIHGVIARSTKLFEKDSLSQ
jgi:Ciliary BBSome complex subunit 2, C-terminal